MVDARVRIIADVHEVLTDLLPAFANQPGEQAKLNAAIQLLGTMPAPELPAPVSTPVPTIEDDLQDIESLLSTYRWSLYNLTTHGMPSIEQETEHYAEAISRIRLANDAPRPDTVVLHKAKLCPGCHCGQTLPVGLQQCACICHLQDRKVPTIPNYLNGMRVIARTKEAIYMRIPEALQAPSTFADDNCTCGSCDGSGKWDTIQIPLQPDNWRRDFATTIHMPDKAVQPFLAAMRRKGLA